MRKTLQKLLLLEKDIERRRIELAKKYVLSQNNDPDALTDADLLGVYYMMTVKAEKLNKKDLTK